MPLDIFKTIHGPENWSDRAGTWKCGTKDQFAQSRGDGFLDLAAGDAVEACPFKSSYRSMTLGIGPIEIEIEETWSDYTRHQSAQWLVRRILMIHVCCGQACIAHLTWF